MATGPVELTPRTASEQIDRAALRELSIAQARLAIDTHTKKRLLKSALVTSGGALACLLATQVVLGFVSSTHTGIHTLASVGYVLAIFWMFAAGTAARQLLRSHLSRQASLRENIERASERRKAVDRDTANTAVEPEAAAEDAVEANDSAVS
jgi:hypothetical protein